jgi:hypothetical protein
MKKLDRCKGQSGLAFKQWFQLGALVWQQGYFPDPLI